MLLFALLTTTHSSGNAQSTDEYRAQVEVLRQEWHVADSTFREFLERESSGPIDTVLVGTLTVLTQREFAQLVEAGARIAWDSIRQLGSDTMLLVGKTLFVPGPGWQHRYDQELHQATYPSRPLNTEGDGMDAADRILSSVGMLLLDDWKLQVQNWLGGHFEMDDANPTKLSWTYVELVTAPSQAVRECLLGVLDACGSVLLMTEVEHPELDWYNADERRVVVERRIPGASTNRGQIRLECVRDRSDAACLEFLTAEIDQVPPPLSLGARRTLVAIALESGGDGAYMRLVNAGALRREVSLTDAAGLSRDSLLSVWRTAVMSAAPRTTTLTHSGAAVAIFWIVVFALAATRSTRWRSS